MSPLPASCRPNRRLFQIALICTIGYSASHCGLSTKTPASTALGVSYALDSATLIHDLAFWNTLPEQLVRDQTNRIAALPLSKFMKERSNSPSTYQVKIDNIVLAVNQATSAKEQNLEKLYPTASLYWQAIGLNPGTLSSEAIQTSLQTLVTHIRDANTSSAKSLKATSSFSENSLALVITPCEFVRDCITLRDFSKELKDHPFRAVTSAENWRRLEQAQSTIKLAANICGSIPNKKCQDLAIKLNLLSEATTTANEIIEGANEFKHKFNREINALENFGNTEHDDKDPKSS